MINRRSELISAGSNSIRNSVSINIIESWASLFKDLCNVKIRTVRIHPFHCAWGRTAVKDIYSSFNAICFRSRGIFNCWVGAQEHPIIRRPVDCSYKYPLFLSFFSHPSSFQTLNCRERTMDSDNQEIKPKKTKGLRSKRQPRQFPPLNTVSTSTITVSFTVGNTISDDALTSTYTFNSLEVEVAETLFLLAHGVVHMSESYSKTKLKMHECTVKFLSGQALGGHKRKHYESVIIIMIAPGTVNSSPNPRAMKKPKYN